MAANLACALDTVHRAIIPATADVGVYAFNKRQMRSRKSPDTGFAEIRSSKKHNRTWGPPQDTVRVESSC